MPTTSNFGWTTPADTDLVKDGALAIRTLGNGIDTSFLDLKGGTTGQNLRKASNTDLDFTFAGDATNTVIDAEGDLLVGDSADTLQRLAIGTTGQVLTVDTTLDGKVKWAAPAGETLISTTTLSGATTVLSSVPQTYNALKILITGVTNLTADGKLRIRPVSQNVSYTGVESGGFVTVGNGEIETNSNLLRTDDRNGFLILVTNYTVLSVQKQPMIFYGQYLATGTVTKTFTFGGSGGSSSGWGTITISNTGGDLSGGEVKLYGVK